jgi:ABC-type proline/glycine betaine transport system ATPase subunit
MTQGGKDAIKKARDHNWDTERMQFQKQRGNILGENDYVSLETKAGSIREVMGSNSGGGKSTTNTKRLLCDTIKVKKT